MDVLIGTIKTTSLAEARQLWQTIVEMLQAARVDAVLVACTDLNAITDMKQQPFSIIDATQQLAVKTIQVWRNLK
jgi:aspartate/glutamate racemase